LAAIVVMARNKSSQISVRADLRDSPKVLEADHYAWGSSASFDQ